MPRVLTVDGSVKIGAYRFPDRKKPCLCVEKGNTCTVYGSFIDTDRANEFMNELAALVGARDDDEAHSYDVVETENGYDIVFHFVKGGETDGNENSE